MAREELEIEIGANGEVRVLTQGVKGKKCLDYVEMFRQLLGPVENQELTPEYNQIENRFEGKTQVRVRNHIEE